MKEPIIETKAEVKLDLTSTVESAYNDALKKPARSSSDIVTTFVDFIHNTLLYPMQKYNLYAKDKLQRYVMTLEERVQQIPMENLVSPKVNILGPTIDGLKYNLDEDYIKEMFTNILLSDMDNRKQNRVLPSYIEIVKQLSKEDAEFLINLKNFNGRFCSISLELEEQNIEGSISLNQYIIYNYKYNEFSKTASFGMSKLDSLVTDTLKMHRLIEQNYEEYYTSSLANKEYNSLFDCVKSNYKLQEGQKLTYSKGIVRLTSFGKNFIDICLS